jgi:Domain of unknown function (DUF4158)
LTRDLVNERDLKTPMRDQAVLLGDRWTPRSGGDGLPLACDNAGLAGGCRLLPLRFVPFACCVWGWPVPAGQFPEDHVERLRTFPDIGRDDLIRYFTLTPADVAFLDPGRAGPGRGPADRLGLAVTLATLPWLGFVPDEVRAAPPATVARLAERLGLDPVVLAGYGQRARPDRSCPGVRSE